MSPRLRPGLVVVRRDDKHLQVGLEPPRRVVLVDMPEVRRLLDDLQHGRPIAASAPGAAGVIARLAAADLLDPSPTAPEPPSLQIVLTGARTLVDAAALALRSAGLAPSRRRGDVHLLLGHGAVDRELADPLVRDGTPHLAAVTTPWGWELGPFVVPGQTACLRCVDAAHTDHDPRYGVVLDQLARSAAPAPVRPATSAAALGWLARDLVAYQRGERPSTWSATVRLPDSPGESPGQSPGVDLIEERRWLRHPHCGCAWDALTG